MGATMALNGLTISITIIIHHLFQILLISTSMRTFKVIGYCLPEHNLQKILYYKFKQTTWFLPKYRPYIQNYWCHLALFSFTFSKLKHQQE